MRHSEGFENDLVHINPVAAFGKAQEPDGFELATQITQRLVDEGYIEHDDQLEVSNEIYSVLEGGI